MADEERIDPGEKDEERSDIENVGKGGWRFLTIILEELIDHIILSDMIPLLLMVGLLGFLGQHQ